MPLERLVPEVRVKPRLRGVFHQYAFFVSLAVVLAGDAFRRRSPGG